MKYTLDVRGLFIALVRLLRRVVHVYQHLEANDQ